MTAVITKTPLHACAMAIVTIAWRSAQHGIKWRRCLPGTARKITMLASASLSMAVPPPWNGWQRLGSGACCGPPLCGGRVYVYWGGTNGTPLHFHAQGGRHRMVPATLCMEMHYVSFVHGEWCCSQQHRPQ